MGVRTIWKSIFWTTHSFFMFGKANLYAIFKTKENNTYLERSQYMGPKQFRWHWFWNSFHNIFDALMYAHITITVQRATEVGWQKTGENNLCIVTKKDRPVNCGQMLPKTVKTPALTIANGVILENFQFLWQQWRHSWLQVEKLWILRLITHLTILTSWPYLSA